MTSRLNLRGGPTLSFELSVEQISLWREDFACLVDNHTLKPQHPFCTLARRDLSLYICRHHLALPRLQSPSGVQVPEIRPCTCRCASGNGMRYLSNYPLPLTVFGEMGHVSKR